MAKVVIICGEAGYHTVSGLLKEGKLQKESLARSFQIDKAWHFYFENVDGLEVQEILEPFEAFLGTKVIDEVGFKINILRD